MSSKRQKLGRRGEDLARLYLEDRGYRVIEKNVRSPWGEIDLVAWKGDCLVFIEVRTRSGDAFGSPEESVTPEKIQRIIDTAGEYLQSRDLLETEWRIDVVAINMNSRGSIRRINLVENAVTL